MFSMLFNKDRTNSLLGTYMHNHTDTQSSYNSHRDRQAHTGTDIGTRQTHKTAFRQAQLQVHKTDIRRRDGIASKLSETFLTHSACS